MADFYGTVAGFEAYWTARGQALAIAEFDDPAEIEAALLVASEFIDLSFVNSFCGLKVGQRAQIREWPRSGVQDRYGYYVDSGSVPREVENATYQAALRQLQTPGIFFKDYTPGKYKNVSISGAVAVTYATGDAFSFQTQMPAIAAILEPILNNGRGSFSGLSGSIDRQ